MRRWLKYFLCLIFLVFIGWPVLAQQGTYPQLDISGFKKWEYKRVNVTPTRNYFAGLTQLGGYYPTFSGGPWQERLQLRLMGQLSENLAVAYDLEQQPEMPDRYDVKVKQDNYELTFGDFSTTFSGNEFATTARTLNGVMVTAKDSWYDVIAIPSAKLKSQTQNLASQNGNNTRGPFSLGHGAIVEGSEKIQLNNIALTRNVDYTIDYFEGKITFNRILTQLDEFKYSYEYTNVLDLFFPSLSKRDFIGLQSRFTINPQEFGKPEQLPEPVMLSTREVFPSSGSQEVELDENEAAGQYQLQSIPIVNFTERLNFMGTLLKKGEDYLIFYNSGKIKLLTRFLPSTSEPLVIEYQYYQASEESTSVSGIGSYGPYYLEKKHLVPESERIEVDGKLLVRDLDYSINNEDAALTFKVVIGPTSQINAKYLYKVYELPKIIPEKFPKELKVGATYLKESAKASSTTAISTITEVFSGDRINTNRNHLYLTNRPVAPTTEAGAVIIIKLDGVTLTPEVDYAFPQTSIDPVTGYTKVSPEAALAYINDRNDPSDGYDTGTIKLLGTRTLTSTNQVTATYSYYKGVVGRYSGVGDNTRGAYFLRNVRNVIPGTETLQVWEQGSSVISTYTRNSSFDADAGDTGYSINYNADTPSITFNRELGTTKNFQVVYQYVPPQTFAGGDLSQSVLGLDSSYKIGDVLKIEAAYARSETDQLAITETTSESFTGNNSRNYTLHSARNIVEGSEKVSVNNRTLNKDIDYFVSYTAPGQISFYYITPASIDAIVVEYSFLSTSGTVANQTLKADTAYKLAAETKLFGNALQLSGNTKHVGFDFTPMGGTSIALGANYKQYDLKFQPQFHSLLTTYSYKENDQPISNSRTRFLRTYDNIVAFGVNPRDALKIDLAYRNYLTLDDLSAAIRNHSNDSAQNSFSLSLAPAEIKRGVMALTLKYDGSRTISQTDAQKDSNSFSENNTNYNHFNTGLKFTDRINLSYDYQASEPKITSLKSSSTEATSEALASHTITVNNAYNVVVDLTFARLEKLTARVNLLQETTKTMLRNFLPTSEVNHTNNQTARLDFVPIKPLTTSLDLNRQERTSFLIGGVNPKTERATATVNLAPINWFSIGWNGTQSDSVPETGAANRSTGKGDIYNANWIMIDKEKFKLNGVFSLNQNNQTAPSGSFEGISTNTNSFSQNYSAALKFIPPIPITLGFIKENYNNKNNHPIPSSQIDTATENQTVTAGLSFTPIRILSLSANYNNKTTSVIRDLRVAPGALNKTVLVSKISFQPTDWGTLVYDHEQEKNAGEIQGGQVSAIDYDKTTNSYSLNINIPIDNPVVSSFVMIASLKEVNYKNNKNSTDDFVASLLTFEGSLNF